MVSRYVFWGFIYSFLGWLWETFYCTITNKRFSNRGFLFGPICPIYGCSITLLKIVLSIQKEVSLPFVFIVSIIGSAIMEYSISYYLEERFHARWWDYSHLPFNLNGRIALPVSMFFGICGIFTVYGLIPLENRLALPLVFYEIASLALTLTLGADLALTEVQLSDLLTKIKEAEANLNTSMEQLYQSASNKSVFDRLSRAQKWMLKRIKVFKPDRSTTISIKNLIEKLTSNKK